MVAIFSLNKAGYFWGGKRGIGGSVPMISPNVSVVPKNAGGFLNLMAGNFGGDKTPVSISGIHIA